MVSREGETFSNHATSLQERQSHQRHVAPPTVPWPPSSSTPINEFNSKGYVMCMCMCLPHIGSADFLAPQPVGVTIGLCLALSSAE